MKVAAVAAILTLIFFGALSASGDITPPVLVAASADRYQIDTAEGPQTITFTLHITDDLSGLNYVQLSFVHEDGYNTYRTCDSWVKEPPSTDISRPCAVTFPQYSAEGRWVVFATYMEDRVGNRQEYRYSECTTWQEGRCLHYAYTSLATELIRSMEITVGQPVPGTGSDIYLPLLVR